MSQNSDGAGGAQQNAPAALNSLEQVQLINEVGKMLARVEFNGDKTKTTKFIEHVDKVFRGSVGAHLTEQMRVECVSAALGDKVTTLWNIAVTEDATLATSWARMKAWLESHYANPQNPRLKAVATLKQMKFS